jgi:hypothetical protein
VILVHTKAAEYATLANRGNTANSIGEDSEATAETAPRHMEDFPKQKSDYKPYWFLLKADIFSDVLSPIAL